MLDIGDQPRRDASIVLCRAAPHGRPRGSWRRFVRCAPQADELIYDEIRRRRADPRLAERDDVLSVLLQARDEDGEPMTDVELRDELMTLLVAGHETTATALAWTFDLLLRNPDGARAPAGGDRRRRVATTTSTRSSRRRCGCGPWCRASCASCRRRWTLGGYELPAGDAGRRRTSTSPTAARTSTPSRSGSARSASSRRPPDTYSWIPFGGGIRRCLGASFALFEMKVVIPAVLSRVRLSRRRARARADPRRAITFVPAHEAMVIAGTSASARPPTPSASPAPVWQLASLPRLMAASRGHSAGAQTVAVIGGTGALGFGLALRWAIAGVPIVIGSRDAERAAEAAERVKARANEAGAPKSRSRASTNEEAAKRARTVVLAVPFRAQSENLNNLRYALQPQTILIDATVPLAAAIGGRATRTLGVWQGSAAQQAAEMAPRGVTVVSALPHRQRRRAFRSRDAAGRGRPDRRRRPQGQGRRRRRWSSGSPACGRSTAATSRWRGSSSSSPRC